MNKYPEKKLSGQTDQQKQTETTGLSRSSTFKTLWRHYLLRLTAYPK